MPSESHKAVLRKARYPVGLVLLLAVHAALLQWVYLERVVPTFASLGNTGRTPNFTNYALAFAMAAAIGLALPRQLRQPSDFILWLYYILVITSSLLVPHYVAAITPGKALELTFVIAALSMAMVLAMRYLPAVAIRGPRIAPQTVAIGVGAFTALAYAYLQFTVGLSLLAPDLGDVREIRFAWREEAAAAGPLLGYVVRILGNITNPLLIGAGVYCRRWAWVAAGFLGQLLLFPITGYKLTLLSAPAIVVLSVLFIQKRRELDGAAMLAGTATLSAAAVVADAIRGGMTFTEYYVDRLLLVPGILTTAHVAVFDNAPKANFGNTTGLSLFFDSPYSESTAFIVGREYRGNAETSSNANMFADGFANAGYLGMAVETAAFVAILWALNAAGARLPIKVTAVLLLMPTIATANSGAFTSVLTNGYAAAFLLMLVLPTAGWVPRPRAGRPALR